ncbi:MAG: hypothetical protein KDK97_02320 [Verrucomicrobiales bacterium]|nr:hypothetical protein [Verrucomicrobiales bacterium]MCP5558995.1 hypothetical protein [Verrucomicrobiaceae bacterium]
MKRLIISQRIHFAALAIATLLFPSSGGAALPGLKITKIYSPIPGPSRFFGDSGALTDRHAILCEPGADGAAHVYDAATGNFLRSLRANDAAAGSIFGSSVAAFGSRVLVGATSFGEANAAYLFDLNTGKQLAKYVPPAVLAENIFARSVFLTATHAICTDPNNASAKGAAYVFDIATGSLVTLTAPDGMAGDSFGNGVYCHGNLLAIGAPRHGGKGAIYRWDLSNGQYLGKVMPSSLAPDDDFGELITGSGKRMYVAASGRAVGGVSNAGALYAVNLDGTIEAEDINFDPNSAIGRYFGYAIAQQGNLIAVTAEQDTVIGDVARRVPLLVIPKNEAGEYAEVRGLAANRLLLADSANDTLANRAGMACIVQTLPEPLSGTSIAAVGDSAPGAAGISFKGLQEAAINSSGQMVLGSSLAGIGSNSGKDFGVWSDRATGNLLELSLKSRDDLGSGVKIASPRSVNVGSNVAIMQATLTGSGINGTNNRALFRDNGTDTAQVLRTGQNITSVTSMNGTRLGSFSQVVQGGSSQVGTSVTLRSGSSPVSSKSDSGILIVNSSTGTTIGTEREGSPVMGMSGVTYGQFAPRYALQSSISAFTAAIVGSTGGNQAIFTKSLGNDAMAAAVKGQPAPGAGGALFSSFVGETVNASSRVHFRATLSGAGVNATNNQGIWLHDGVALKLIARTGDPITGLPGLVWSRFLHAWPMTGRMIIRAQLRGAGVTSKNDEAIILYQEDGSFLKLFREGDIVPECDGLRAGAFQRVEVAGVGWEYRILVPLVGSSATRNQALLRGNVGKGSVSIAQIMRTPELMLRKGSVVTSPLGGKVAITSIAFANSLTQDATGVGGKGLPSVVSDAGTLLKLALTGGSVQIVNQP